jgi:iron complex outermembrane receptor protein
VAKNTFLLLILLALSGGVYTQQKPTRVKKIAISGTISEILTGEIMPGASVYLADDRAGTTTDHAGHFTITGLPPGHHVVEITHAGFATLVEHIEVENDTVIHFQLSPVVVENQGVIITGVSSATSIRKAPIPVASLRRAELMQNSSTNIIDALTRVPGVSQLSTGPAVSKPMIRGLGFNRVVVVNEGVRQEGQQWGDEHGIEIDEMSVGRVEILKGPASLMYGSDALAGVINFITNTPVSQGVIRGNISSQFQSNPGLFSFYGNLAGNRNGFNWNVYGSFKSAHDYKNKWDGRVLNSRFNEGNFGGYVGVNKSWGYSHLVFSRFHMENGIVEGERDPGTGEFLMFAGTTLERIATKEDLADRNPTVPYQDVRHNKIITDNNFVIGRNRLKLNLAYQQNLRVEFGDVMMPVKPELSFDLETVNYNVQWQFPEIREWHTTVGLNGMKQWNTNRAEEVVIPEYELFDFGVFAFAQRFFSKTTLSGGLRYDSRHLQTEQLNEGADVRFKSLQRNFSNFSGSIGISRELSDKVALKLNLARGFRIPTVAELLSNGIHEGTGRYEYGTASLRPETSLQGDAGLDMSFEHFNLGLSLFYNGISDFIFYRKLQSVSGGDSLVDVDGDLVPAYQFNQQDAALLGLEFSLDIHPHPLDWLHFENSFSFVRGRFQSAVAGDRDLPLIPAPRIISELRADFPNPGKSFKNLYARVEADHNFSQVNPFSAFSTETPTPGYTLLNLGAGVDLIEKKKQRTVLSVHISLINALDKTYQNHLSRLKYTAANLVTGRQGVFNMGRNISLRINIPLHFKR